MSFQTPDVPTGCSMAIWGGPCWFRCIMVHSSWSFCKSRPFWRDRNGATPHIPTLAFLGCSPKYNSITLSIQSIPIPFIETKKDQPRMSIMSLDPDFPIKSSSCSSSQDDIFTAGQPILDMIFFRPAFTASLEVPNGDFRNLN